MNIGTISIRILLGTYFINAHWLRLKDHLELHGVTDQQAWSQLSNCRWLNPH